MTAAHDQKLTIHLLTHVPEHEPRTSDPLYHLFDGVKRRMKRLGLLVCSIPDCTFGGPIELHHDKVEYSLQNGIDLDKFNAHYNLHLEDDAAYKKYIEGPGNLEPLCAIHHRTHMGVHELPTPFWAALRVWKSELAPPAEVIAA